MSTTSSARAPRRPASRPQPRPQARPQARTPRRPRLAVVPERIARRSRVPFLGLVGLVLVLGVGGLLLFNTWMQQSAFTATRLQDRADDLENRQQSLSMALEKKNDPQELAVRARGLGLVPAVNPAFVRLGDGKVLGEPKAAAAGDAMRINPRPAAKPADLNPRPRVVRVPAPTPALTPAQVKAKAQADAAAKKRQASTVQGRVQQNIQQNGNAG
ncbi:hypothetical protein GCM10011519_09420 [Marmoricola endophyticus]|uniref:Cell division protein FtsL n=1 Tax=Marmoricola endophyticus TaxID=2040280 RepID=A0A917F2D2_9ACTN|nr:hypothetical protein [Marmoricola endophyticus]GGF37990.1 hypothetical protein GCM10011519_09420 [Marmoricola endophyticus]